MCKIACGELHIGCLEKCVYGKSARCLAVNSMQRHENNNDNVDVDDYVCFGAVLGVGEGGQGAGNIIGMGFWRGAAPTAKNIL